MLPRGQRIAREFFPRHTERSFLWNGAVLRARLYSSEQTGNAPRFSIVVAKKYSKSAVVRNRFRRQVYALIAEQLKVSSPLRVGRFVISPKHAIGEISPELLLSDVLSLFAHARI